MAESNPDPDWRLAGQEAYLRGAKVVFQRYRAPSTDWDHDHCDFCWEKFSVESKPGVHNEGYATENRKHWICKQCLADFREQFELIVLNE